ncbi:MAG TPA: hypothetical protein PLW46_02905 [Acinetobacter johnsonii]|nr:hypothetical protein [Acinetobacter johnsonii]
MSKVTKPQLATQKKPKVVKPITTVKQVLEATRALYPGFGEYIDYLIEIVGEVDVENVTSQVILDATDDEDQSYADEASAFIKEALAKFKAEAASQKAGETPADESKPTKADAEKDAGLAKKLGVDQTTLMLLLAGGGNATSLFTMINVETLLGMYDPEDPDNMASSILQQRFGQEAVIAFKPGTREVALAETSDYIRDRRRGYPKEDSIYVGDKLARLYAIGVIPLDFVEEDPMYPGVVLRRGRSTQNRISYQGIPLDVRQLIRIIVERGDINVRDRGDRRTVETLMKQGFDELAEEFAEAALNFEERQAAGTLPTLRSQLGGGTPSSNAPFRGGPTRGRFEV